jgi:hypothetical protein
MCSASPPEGIITSEAKPGGKMRELVSQFPGTDDLQLISAMQANVDEADCLIDVSFLESIECELTDAMASEDWDRTAICVALTAILVRKRGGGDRIKMVFFKEVLPSLMDLVPWVPDDLRYDIVDVLSCIVMTWVPCEWISDDVVKITCELHKDALRDGSFGDRERAYRFFHNFLVRFPDIAGEIVVPQDFDLFFGFIVETDLLLDDDCWTSIFVIVDRAITIDYHLDYLLEYLGGHESSARVRLVKERIPKPAYK